MNVRGRLTVKILAFLLAVVSMAGAAVLGWYQLANLGQLWMEEDVLDSEAVYRLLRQDGERIGLVLNQSSINGEDISQALDETYDPEKSNLRWQLLNLQGEVIAGNYESKYPASTTGRIYYTEYVPWMLWDYMVQQVTDVTWKDLGGTEGANQPVVRTDRWREELAYQLEYMEYTGVDFRTVYLNGDGTGTLLLVDTQYGTLVYGPSLENILYGTPVGYTYDLETDTWNQSGEGVVEGGTYLDLLLWVDPNLPVETDVYAQTIAGLSWWQSHRVAMLLATVACALTGVALTVFLCFAAGHRRGQKEAVSAPIHRIPLEPVAVVVVVAMALVVSGTIECVLYYFPRLAMKTQLVALGCATALAMGLGLFALTTLAVRVKTHTFLSTTWTWRLCRWLGRLFRRVGHCLPLVWKVALGGAVYVILSILLYGWLWVLLTVAAVVGCCIWGYHWKRIRIATQQLLEGDLEVKIDCEKMPSDLKEHAQQLNNLGGAIAGAVAEQMKSEHFKAELITNVSHDLKTPLTSIINYVDLLKKEPTDNPKVTEYLEVLDRKSQRLKKLTEDLVEASKASTGVLSVEPVALDFGQLVDQALGEYVERLEERGLAVVRTIPSQPVRVWADGRRLWRVLDNLLSNCAKYALEGTRVYVEIQSDGEWGYLWMKNISRDELNVPVETLMERFVRGDRSRTTEGSGLGLSIAQSMTELQGGKLSIEIDGDLFKVRLALPLAPKGEEQEVEG